MTKLSLHALFMFTLLAGIMLAAAVDANAQTARSKAVRSQSARIVIGQYGYEPATIRLKRGVPAKITFRRITESTCATEVVFADYGIRRDLPMNTDVTVRLTPKKAGEFNFTCGMNMHRGKMIVSH